MILDLLTSNSISIKKVKWLFCGDVLGWWEEIENKRGAIEAIPMAHICTLYYTTEKAYRYMMKRSENIKP